MSRSGSYSWPKPSRRDNTGVTLSGGKNLVTRQWKCFAFAKCDAGIFSAKFDCSTGICLLLMHCLHAQLLDPFEDPKSAEAYSITEQHS